MSFNRNGKKDHNTSEKPHCDEIAVTGEMAHTGDSLYIPNIINGIDRTSVGIQDHNAIRNAVATETEKGTEIFGSTLVSYIISTEDSFKIKMLEYENAQSVKNDLRIKIINSVSSLKAYGGIFLTLITTYMATTFKKFLFSVETWRAIYVITFLTCIVLTVNECVKLIKNKQKLKKLKTPDIDRFIELLKKKK